MKLQLIKRYSWNILLLLLIAFPAVVLAVGGKGLTGITENIFEPTSLLAKFLYAACYVVGIALILGSFLEYHEHHENPTHVHFSHVVYLFLFGVAIVLIPIIARFSASAGAAGG